MTLLQYALLYLALINLVAFVAMGADKRKARHHARRTGEAALLFLAVIGGSAGAICGMLIFRHKTSHAAFSIGLPLIFLIQCVLICAFCRLFALN